VVGLQPYQPLPSTVHITGVEITSRPLSQLNGTFNITWYNFSLGQRLQRKIELVNLTPRVFLAYRDPGNDHEVARLLAVLFWIVERACEIAENWSE